MAAPLPPAAFSVLVNVLAHDAEPARQATVSTSPDSDVVRVADRGSVYALMDTGHAPPNLVSRIIGIALDPAANDDDDSSLSHVSIDSIALAPRTRSGALVTVTFRLRYRVNGLARAGAFAELFYLQT